MCPCGARRGDGVGEDAVPRGGCGLRERAGGVRVDGSVPDQVSRIGVLGAGVEDAERGHHHLHARANGAEGSRAVIPAGGVGLGGRREEEIGEDVGAQLRGGALVGESGRHGGGTRIAMIDDGAGLLSQSVADADGEDRGKGGDEIGHAVAPVTTRTPRVSRPRA